MKIRVYSQILLQCMERCARISYDSTLWMSSRVRFALVESRQLRLTVATESTWIDTVLNCDVEKPGAPILFECDDLMNILRSLGEGPIRIDATGKSAQISGANKRSYRLPIHPNAEDYRDPPKVEGSLSAKLTAATLRDAIESVKFAVPTDMAHPGHCFVLLEFSKDTVASFASEGHIFAHKTLPCPSAKSDFQISIPCMDGDKRTNFLKAILELRSIDPICITLSDKHLFVESEDSLLCSNLPAAQPMNFALVHKNTIVFPAPLCVVNTDLFKHALAAVGLLKEKDPAYENSNPPNVRVQLAGTTLTISRTTSEAYAQDEIEAVPAHENAELNCHIDPAWLKSCVAAVPSPTFTICTVGNDINSPFGIMSDDDEKSYDCIVMKMREDRPR